MPMASIAFASSIGPCQCNETCLSDRASTGSVARAVTQHLCSVKLSGCKADGYVRILRNVSVILPVSVARCLFDLQPCSIDSLSFCYERTCGAEVALQTLQIA